MKKKFKEGQTVGFRGCVFVIDSINHDTCLAMVRPVQKVLRSEPIPANIGDLHHNFQTQKKWKPQD